MHPRQAALLAKANDFTAAKKKQTEQQKSSAPLLWKYVDPESGKDFYLTEKKTTVRSPYSGKMITVKPEKLNLSGVGKELKEDAKAAKLCLSPMKLSCSTR